MIEFLTDLSEQQARLYALLIFFPFDILMWRVLG